MNNLADWIEREGVDKFIRVFGVPESCLACPAKDDCQHSFGEDDLGCRDYFSLWAEEEASPTRTLAWDNAVALSRIANDLGTIAKQMVKDRGPMTDQMKLAGRE